MIADSGERKTFGNGFNRDITEGKGRMDLLPWEAIRQVSIHCEEGAKKYGERNIDKGAPQWSLQSSAMRHMSKAVEPVEGDPEDTLVHYRAAAWNALWALQQYVKQMGSTEELEPEPIEPEPGAPEAPKDKPKKKGGKKKGGSYDIAKPKDVPKVKALRAAGWSYAKIVDEFNVSSGTIYNWLKEDSDD